MTKRWESVLAAAGCLCLAAWISGCSTEHQPDMGAVEEIAGLVGASGQEGGNPPKLVAGASPVLSSEVLKALEASSAGYEVVVRVLVDANHTPIGVRVLKTVPPDSPEAERYATDVAKSVWDWRYESANRDGSPVRAYLDLTFRHNAGVTEE